MIKVQLSGVIAIVLLFIQAPVLNAQPSLPDEGKGVTVSFPFEIQLGPILSQPPPLPIPALPGSTVRFTLSGISADQISFIEWSKNLAPLDEHGSELVLTGVKESDNGQYIATVMTVNGDVGRATRVLHVSDFPRQRLLNLSTRASISASGPTVISGFVIDTGPGDPASAKQVLIRAVGPSLQDYGVGDALADPTLTLFRADGSTLDVADHLRDPQLIADASRRTGASPLRPAALDTGMLISLRGGVYTAHVNSRSRGTGEVLLEIYEVSR
jgi:hypothetical protein